MYLQLVHDGVTFCCSGVARRLSKMGKKVDRAKTDKSSSSGHHGESADDGNKSPGLYLHMHNDKGACRT